jgi:hypothetical protein
MADNGNGKNQGGREIILALIGLVSAVGVAAISHLREIGEFFGFKPSQFSASPSPSPTQLPTNSSSPSPTETPVIAPPFPKTGPLSSPPTTNVFPPALNSKPISVKVKAEEGCTDLDIGLVSGGAVSFEADGYAKYGYEGEPVNDSPMTNPEGGRFLDGKQLSPKFAKESSIFMPTEPVGSLVARIGADPFFKIGRSKSIQVSKGEKLSLCYNDASDGLGNNSGSYTVKIQIKNN